MEKKIKIFIIVILVIWMIILTYIVSIKMKQNNINNNNSQTNMNKIKEMEIEKQKQEEEKKENRPKYGIYLGNNKILYIEGNEIKGFRNFSNEKIKEKQFFNISTLEVSNIPNNLEINLGFAEELKRDHSEVQLIDVRTKEEYESGHVKNSTLLPLNEIRSGNISILDKNKVILLYCRSGNRSGMAQQILSEKGYITANAGGVAAFSGTLERKLEEKK